MATHELMSAKHTTLAQGLQETLEPIIKSQVALSPHLLEIQCPRTGECLPPAPKSGAGKYRGAAESGWGTKLVSCTLQIICQKGGPPLSQQPLSKCQGRCEGESRLLITRSGTGKHRGEETCATAH